MSEDWKPGDVVVCVDAKDYSHGEFLPLPLRVGDMYTVIQLAQRNKIAYTPLGIVSTGVVLVLLEVKNHDSTTGGFCASRFKKQPSLVIEADQSMELETQ